MSNTTSAVFRPLLPGLLLAAACGLAAAGAPAATVRPLVAEAHPPSPIVLALTPLPRTRPGPEETAPPPADASGTAGAAPAEGASGSAELLHGTGETAAGDAAGAAEDVAATKDQDVGPDASAEPGPLAAAGEAGDGTAEPVAAVPERDATASVDAAGAEGAADSATEKTAAAAAGRPPLPRERPTGEALRVATAAHVPPGPPYGFSAAPELAAALKAVEADRYDDALRIRRNLRDPIGGRIIDWLVAAAPNSGLSADDILAIRDRDRGWPEPEKLRLRAEQAFLRTPHSDAEFAAFFADERPLTMTGRIAAVRVALRQDRLEEAAGGARQVWRTERMPESLASRFSQEFADLLRPQDHITRLHLLVYDRDIGQARRHAERIGPGHAEYAVTMIAALGRKHLAVKDLEAVPPKLRDDPIYRLAQVRALRRADRQIAAAQVLFHVDPAAEAETDPDQWWDERRDLSRELLDRGYAELAYKVVAGHSARSEADRVEAEFHAGWYALRFLDRPHPAKAHFQRVAGLATIPQTTSRAHYWLGRAHEATGHAEAARLSHSIAARYGSTFYGQLSGDLIGLDGAHLATLPRITIRDRLSFARNDIAEAIRRLAASGYGHRAWPFFEALGHSLETPGEFALATILARRIDQPRSLLQIAAVAGRRGIDIGALNAPLIGVPKSVPVPDSIDRAMVYAVSRQESAFIPGAVSHAGARGLMQLMTATARATARSIGISFSADRLTRDPAYNATLGAAHLGELITNLSGSYVMTFAGYNAGPGRALRWARAYGDPRNESTDPVDWIERIPFDETRDYVQKVMANLQVYRARLGLPTSPIGDLSRGTPRS